MHMRELYDVCTQSRCLGIIESWPAWTWTHTVESTALMMIRCALMMVTRNPRAVHTFYEYACVRERAPTLRDRSRMCDGYVR